jgi:hypothetical protein
LKLVHVASGTLAASGTRQETFHHEMPVQQTKNAVGDTAIVSMSMTMLWYYLKKTT